MNVNKIISEEKVNIETGELSVHHKTISYTLKKEPEFAKLYFKDICNLQLLSSSCHLVFWQIAEIMDYKTNEVVLVKSIKDKIATKLKCSIKLVEKCVDELYRKEFLFRTERSTYVVNPNYICKGTWADVEKIKMEIVYTEKGRDIVTTFESK